jgi:DNA topoisomerase VI subunit A
VPLVGHYDSDRALAALANILGVRRKALGFVEARRGTVYGRLIIRNGAEILDLSQMGRGGHSVPRFTVASRLAETKWWEGARCIIVCGEGFPSLSTREFVRMLVDTLGIPALICVDADPGCASRPS